jgi:hypothetical protein
LVIGDLSSDEILIVEGIQGLRDGQALNIQNIQDIQDIQTNDLKLTQEQLESKVAG